MSPEFLLVLKIIGIIVALLTFGLTFLGFLASVVCFGFSLGRLKKQIEELNQSVIDLRVVLFKKEGGVAFRSTVECETYRTQFQESFCRKIDGLSAILDKWDERWIKINTHVETTNKVLTFVEKRQDALEKKKQLEGNPLS